MSNHYEPKEQDTPQDKAVFDAVNWLKADLSTAWSGYEPHHSHVILCSDGDYLTDIASGHRDDSLVCTVEEFNQCVKDMSINDDQKDFDRYRLRNKYDVVNCLLSKENSDYSHYERPSKLRMDYFLNLDFYLDPSDCREVVNDVEYITSFAPRKNTGEQPCGDDMPVLVEYYYNHRDYGTKAFSPDEVTWSQRSAYKSWTPDINALIKMQDERDAKEEDQASKNLLKAVFESELDPFVELSKSADDFKDLIETVKKRIKDTNVQQKYTVERAKLTNTPAENMLCRVEYKCPEAGSITSDFTFKFETDIEYTGIDEFGNTDIIPKNWFEAWHPVDECNEKEVAKEKQIDNFKAQLSSNGLSLSRATIMLMQELDMLAEILPLKK